MSDSLGSFCLVLHAHIPYVLRHGDWPHGTAWLYEAIAETYLPLLDLIGEIALNGQHPEITLGLTPVLLEQLADEEAQRGFVAYANERIARARDDRAWFLRQGDGRLAGLAEQWENFYASKLEHFERIGRNVARQFVQRQNEGHIQLLGGAATHSYLPLLTTDQAIRAQLAAGAASSSAIVGRTLPGLWLPECAYRPAADCWRPPVIEDAPISADPGRYRPGIESFLPTVGVTHTFLDSHCIAGGAPLGVFADGRFFAAGSPQMQRDRKSGWRESLEPVGISSEPGRAEVFAFARHPSLTQQVWSSRVGYPGDGAYLEFHKKHEGISAGYGGLRYWRVTDVMADLGAKEPYDPNAVAGRLYANAQHFCAMVRDVLRDYLNRTGRRGVCIAAFDAELFGHWWFEGPRFLRDVILTLGSDTTIARQTTEAALADVGSDKVMRPIEGSWGRGGDHSVWYNADTRWIWDVEHRAEREMVYQVQHLPWRTNADVAEALHWAGRELLLLQASDWPFVVENGSALDYGIKRFSLHVSRFERAIDIAKRRAAGVADGELQTAQLAEMKAHDPVFSTIDLNWW